MVTTDEVLRLWIQTQDVPWVTQRTAWLGRGTECANGHQSASPAPLNISFTLNSDLSEVCFLLVKTCLPALGRSSPSKRMPSWKIQRSLPSRGHIRWQCTVCSWDTGLGVRDPGWRIKPSSVQCLLFLVLGAKEIKERRVLQTITIPWVHLTHSNLQKRNLTLQTSSVVFCLHLKFHLRQSGSLNVLSAAWRKSHNDSNCTDV